MTRTSLTDRRSWYAALVAASVVGCAPAQKPSEMTFFVTSVSPSGGGNLGGLIGADAHGHKLAEAVGAGGRQWRAYLSAPAANGQPAVHAKDRIGAGPWVTIKGVQIAASNQDLHSGPNAIERKTALTERGLPVPHDMLTGSNADGTLAPGDATCLGWTSDQGHAVVGHSDKQAQAAGERMRSWNSAHSFEGCSQAAFQSTAGAGLFYCFATK